MWWETPRISGFLQKVGEQQEESPSEAPQRSHPADTVILDLQACERSSFCCSQHLVCGHQPWEQSLLGVLSITNPKNPHGGITAATDPGVMSRPQKAPKGDGVVVAGGVLLLSRLKKDLQAAAPEPRAHCPLPREPCA